MEERLLYVWARGGHVNDTQRSARAISHKDSVENKRGEAAESFGVIAIVIYLSSSLQMEIKSRNKASYERQVDEKTQS